MPPVKTNSGLSPEIVHFRIPSDGMENHMPRDWYIKGARYVLSNVHVYPYMNTLVRPGAYPPLDARHILRWV